MMDPGLAGALMLALLGVLLIAGMPIGLSLAASGIAGLAMTRGLMPLEFLLGAFSYSYTANLAYIVLPLFLFMGHMAFASGVSERAFNAAEKIIARISQRWGCIGALNEAKLLYRNHLARIRGAPRCPHSVTQICSVLHPCKGARWWPPSTEVPSHRMPAPCCSAPPFGPSAW